jgi:signal transduction histidine kinase
MLCSVLKLTDGKLYNWASPRLPKEYVDAISGISASFGVGSCGTAAFLKEKVIVTDIDNDPLWKDYRELAAKFAFKACWSHPLIDSHQNVLGTFAIYYKTIRNGSPAEEMSIERARIILTSIVENKMAEDELWLKEKALKQSHELLEKLTDQVPAAIYQFKITPDGKMSFEFISNGVTKVIPGITPENIKENVLLGFSMIHPDDTEIFRQSLFASRDNLNDWNLEYRILTETKKIIWHKVTAHPEKKEDGSVVWYGYFQDVTGQKRQEQEREQLILELSQNNKDLRHFSYITSHNLRAPLSNLVGLVNLIEDMPVEDLVMAELLKGFKTSTLLLNDTVNDLLKVLTIKDNLSIKQEEIELAPIMEKVLSQIQLLIDSIKPEINFHFTECPIITFNKVYMESIFLNLITNAIKYRSPKRKLQISVISRDLGNCMSLTFADNGLGVDTERYKDRIFGLYQRFHNHPDSKGFGLYMVKSQMEALGGHIEIKSKVDEGTQLILTFKK